MGITPWRGLSVKDSLAMILASSSIVRTGLLGCIVILGLSCPLWAGDGKQQPELPAQVFSPPKMAPLASVAVFPSEIALTTTRDRQSIVVQATFTDRNHPAARATKESGTEPGQHQAGPSGGGGVLSGGRWRHDGFGRLWRPNDRGASQGGPGGHDSAGQLPARRHAGLHAGGLQHR